jgi:hypothetical protein
MRWVLLRWLLVAVLLIGLLMASGDGPLFPWTNLAGVAVMAGAVLALRRDPAFKGVAG